MENDELAEAVRYFTTKSYVENWRASAVIIALSDLTRENEELKRDRVKLIELVECFVDPDPCSFDHHGGCQAHGFLSLGPGEMCPNEEAKRLIALSGKEGEDG